MSSVRRRPAQQGQQCPRSRPLTPPSHLGPLHRSPPACSGRPSGPERSALAAVDAEERQWAAALWCLPKVADFHRLLTLQADDLWLLVREVQRVLQARYKPRGFEFGVQDGKLAGQSVPHVHVHVLPNGHV